jgi:SAM-dependent methyltransferase
MDAILPDSAWEAMFAPYDQATYEAVLDQLGPDDVILEIGAGDLRLARQMARIVRKVYAVEINARVLEHTAWDPLPANLMPICADAREIDFPDDVTVGVLLMRHCTCFRLYAEKLRQAGASRLITNARWRMDIETINLWAPRTTFAKARIGWYACSCGWTGFKEGAVECWSFEMDRIISEVSDCLHCTQD